MSKGNFLLGTAAGKLGDVVLFRAGGQQRARSYVQNVRNPRSDAQVRQRARFAACATAYKQFRGVSSTFQTLKDSESGYNAFLRSNIAVVPVLTRGSINYLNQNNFVPLVPWTIANGSLNSPTSFTSSASEVSGQGNFVYTFPSISVSEIVSFLGLSSTPGTRSVSWEQYINLFGSVYFGSPFIHPVLYWGVGYNSDASDRPSGYSYNCLGTFGFLEVWEKDLIASSSTVFNVVVAASGTTIETVAVDTITRGSITVEFVFTGGSTVGLQMTVKTPLFTAPVDFIKGVFVAKRVGGVDTSKETIILPSRLQTDYETSLRIGNSSADILETWRNSSEMSDAKVFI